MNAFEVQNRSVGSERMGRDRMGPSPGECVLIDERGGAGGMVGRRALGNA